jgi:hypothetical protein
MVLESNTKLFSERISKFTFTCPAPGRHSPQPPLTPVTSDLQNSPTESNKLENPVEQTLVKLEAFEGNQDEELAVLHSPRKAASVKPEPSVTPVARVQASRVVKKRIRNVDSYDVSPTKKKRGYAPPEAYAHLGLLPDHLKDELDGENVWL